MMEGPTRELLRPGDVSASLGVTTGRVYQLIAAGQIPHVRVGNSIRILRLAWESWLAAQNRKAEGSTVRA
jgi:excisionase family DNA binding protein